LSPPTTPMEVFRCEMAPIFFVGAAHGTLGLQCHCCYISSSDAYPLIRPAREALPVTALPLVHSVEQKSIGLKFSKFRTGGHVTYSCHYNSSLFTFPIFAHSWRFSVFHSLQSITPRIYKPKTTIHLLHFKLTL